MNKYLLASMTLLALGSIPVNAQDSTTYELQLRVPLLDLPQNSQLPHKAPSMNQALEGSNDVYELGFWGIDHLGDKLFKVKNKPQTNTRKYGNLAFKYALGLGFSKYGSELPIPLGVWGHEEFHRSVLGVNGVASENGNWLFSRWDGTVYGIADSTLSGLKKTNPDQLLYSYVAGVQYEIALNEKATLNDFYSKRTLNKTALLLYNAHYVYNYFKFSASAFSDSVKVLAPPHESTDPSKRDYAGADLTAWAYDMFNPQLPYETRDSFPNGEGVNRRIGFSDLSPEAQSYLKKQKNLSLLNFLNPAIFFVNRIRVNEQLAFNLFTQYAPTHFGNDIAVFLPVKYKQFDLLLDLHRYSNRAEQGTGVGLGIYNYKLNDKLKSSVKVNIWNQPKAFDGTDKTFGGCLSLSSEYRIKNNFSAYANLSAKTEGWMLGNPYLDKNLSMQVGVTYQIGR
ncbi:MAG: hypothetical protein ACYC1Q_00890 [Bacteroidia bacterium]